MDAKNFLFCSLDAALVGDIVIPNLYYRDDIGGTTSANAG